MAYICGIENNIKMEAIVQPQMETLTIKFPKVDLQRLKGIAKAMGWTLEKKESTPQIADTEEWTEEQEREAFLHTSRVNAAKMCAKYL